MSILAAGLGLAQGAIGLGQTVAGLFKKKPELPEYDIPNEYYQNMSEAEYESFIGLPEAQKREFIDNIQRGGQTAMQQATSRKGGMGLVAGVQQQMADSARQLLSADAAARAEKLNVVKQMRANLGEQKSIQQSVSRDNIMQERNEINEMRGAGMQNLMGSLGTMFGIDAETGVLSDFFKKDKALSVNNLVTKDDVKSVKSTLKNPAPSVFIS